MVPIDIRERIPLHYAAKGGYEKIVKLLLQCWNAEAYIKSNSQDQGHRNRYNILLIVDIIKDLIFFFQ